MFRKKLRGQIDCISLREEVCVGDFEICFEWRDYLQGKIEHKMGKEIIMGGEGFSCVLEVEGELLFGCRIDKSNFI